MLTARALRFRLPDHVSAKRLWEHVSVAPRARLVTSKYFDTRRNDFLQVRAALRLRRDARIWTQTFGAEPTDTSAPPARCEWTCSAPRGQLRLGAFPVEEIRTLTGLRLSRLEPRLVHRFTTRFLRKSCTLEVLGGARIEVALDQGYIESGSRRLRIRELGLGLIDGNPLDLLSFVRSWIAPLELQLEVESKAERGYMLLAGTLERPRKACQVRLDASMPVSGVAAVVSGSCLRQVAANVERVAHGRDPEALHQLRVGLRRTRTALQLFRAPNVPLHTQQLMAEMDTLNPVLGAARDADVVVGLIEGVCGDDAEGQALVAAEKRVRTRRRRQARVRIAGRAFQSLLLDLLEWMIRMRSDTERSTAVPALRRPASHFVRRALHKLSQRARYSGEGCDWMLPSARHVVRVRLKRLRYACAFLATHPAASSHCKGARHLESLQDILGELNDIAIALRRLHALSGGRNGAIANRVAHRLSERESELQPRLAASWKAWLRHRSVARPAGRCGQE